MNAGWFAPEWPVPTCVHAAVVTRDAPGVSAAPYGRCNLGAASGDDPAAVAANRAGLVAALGLPSAPRWLRQVHGCDVLDADHDGRVEPAADAAVTRQTGTVLAILTADCLPVLLAHRDGHAIGAAHAGWRGLAGGVLEATLTTLGGAAGDWHAWLGPCIGQRSYEIGEEVRAAFVDRDAGAVACFAATRRGHWNCDLAGLAARRLRAAGVTSIHGGGFDTWADPRFHSYRRDGARSGRFATLIWRATD